MKSIIGSMIAVAGILIAGNIMAEEIPPLAKKLNCTACHTLDRKTIGPSFKDIAKKYTGTGATKFTFNGKEYPLIEGLVMKVSKGGSGNWGAMPMPANDAAGAKQTEMTELVKFILKVPTK